jgi:hypothetical protein
MEQTAFEQMVLEGVQENFQRSGAVNAMLLGMLDEKLGVFPIEQLMANKPLVGQLISQLREQVPMLAMVSEGWFARVEKDEKLVSPSEHPNREEVVLVSFYFGLKSKVLMASIHRPVGCSPHLGEFEDRMAGCTKVEGTLFQHPVRWN